MADFDIDLAKRLRQMLVPHIAAIATWFADGAQITIVIRHPSLPDGSALFTNDDPVQIKNAIDRRIDMGREFSEDGTIING